MTTLDFSQILEGKIVLESIDTVTLLEQLEQAVAGSND